MVMHYISFVTTPNLGWATFCIKKKKKLLFVHKNPLMSNMKVSLMDDQCDGQIFIHARGKCFHIADTYFKEVLKSKNDPYMFCQHFCFPARWRS